jgi:hypothetical protein
MGGKWMRLFRLEHLSKRSCFERQLLLLYSQGTWIFASKLPELAAGIICERKI